MFTDDSEKFIFLHVNFFTLQIKILYFAIHLIMKKISPSLVVFNHFYRVNQYLNMNQIKLIFLLKVSLLQLNLISSRIPIIRLLQISPLITH